MKQRVFRTVEERLAHEEAVMREAAEPTGFDVLMENKEKGLVRMRKLLRDEPSLSRKQLASKLDISLRTMYRYFRIIRKEQKVKTTGVDILVVEKEKRKKGLSKLLSKNPSASVTWLAQKLGISRKTLYSYLKELGI